MSPSVRSDDLIAAYREKYAAGDIQLWQFEEAVDRALAGRPSAAEETDAVYRASLRFPRSDEWFVLAHERRLKQLLG